MANELCNDGRCKLVRLGKDRHPSHMGEKDKDGISYEQRKLAFLQIGIGVIITLGSVIIAMGLSQQTTSTVIGMTSNLINDTATSQVFQEQSKEILNQANWHIILGIVIIALGLFLGVVMLFKKNK